MFIICGLRVVFSTIARGVFYCRKCGGDRNYRHRVGRRFVTLFFIPVIPLNKVGEHVLCTTCRSRYVTGALRLPTAAAMQSVLSAGVRAMVSVMLRAGDPAGMRARQRAIEAVTSAGAEDYDVTALDADLAQPPVAAEPPIAALGAQLKAEAREWHLAEMIRIGMADGPLSGAERVAAEAIASGLGMTPAQTLGVITLTEQSAGQS